MIIYYELENMDKKWVGEYMPMESPTHSVQRRNSQMALRYFHLYLSIGKIKKQL